MNIEALNIMQRVLILEKLIKLDKVDLFKSTISGFIENSLDEFEKGNLTVTLTELKTNNNKEVLESLNYLRINIVGRLFDTPCTKEWNSLISTNNQDIKFCGDCKRNVFKVYNKNDYKKHRQLNQCVAINYASYEKIKDSLGCEISLIENYELLGSPSTIDE